MKGGLRQTWPSNESALEAILEAIDNAGYEAGSDILLGLDVASTEFYIEDQYHLESEGKHFSAPLVRRLLVRFSGPVPHCYH